MRRRRNESGSMRIETELKPDYFASVEGAIYNMGGGTIRMVRVWPDHFFRTIISVGRVLNDCEGRYTSQIKSLTIANCQAGKPQLHIVQSSVRYSGLRDALYFRLLPRLAWFPTLSRFNAAVTACFTSLRTFGDRYARLGVGRLNLDLKSRRILISTIDSSMWLYRTLLMKRRVERAIKAGVVTRNNIHCVSVAPVGATM